MREVIRISNRVWYAMYYDCLVDKEQLQISWLKDAERDYFNCAHELGELSETDLDFIEGCFNTLKIKPAVYLTPTADSLFVTRLLQRGYQENHRELECWYQANLHLAFMDELNLKNINLVAPELKLECLIFSPLTQPHYLCQFFELNKLANKISDHLIQRLTKNLITPKNSQVNFFVSIILMDNIVVACGLIALYQGICFFSEGGTHPNFRRRGLYTWLRAQGIKFAKHMGCNKAVVNCDCTAYSNQAFQKLGFTLMGVRRFFQKAVDFVP
jgi:hypothetical protein